MTPDSNFQHQSRQEIFQAVSDGQFKGKASIFHIYNYVKNMEPVFI